MAAGRKATDVNAYLTVCLALCLTLVISLCLALIEGARENGGRLEAECVADIAMESVMAEYHRELMKQYNLFAIDSSYGTAVCGKENVEEHLKSYLDKNLNVRDLFLAGYLYRDFFGLKVKNAEVTEVSILSDENGAVFRRAAVDAVKEDVGIGLLEDVRQWMQVIEVNGLEDGEEEARKQELDEEIAGYDGTVVEIKENVKETVSVTNPTDAIEEKRKLGILKQIAEEEQFSEKVLVAGGLIESRMQQGMVNRGNTVLSQVTEAEALAERFFFQEYLLKYMGYCGKEKNGAALDYQVEYLIGGNAADIDNLRMIVNRICMIREAANAIYLMGCEEKRAEMKLVSEVVGALILLPQLAPLMEAAILLGWAYAESVYDVKTLLSGGRIPLLKSDDNWHYSLATALSGEWKAQGDNDEGMCYADYLRVFMMFQDVDTITVRAMNMVEADIRSTPGNACFRLDACYEAIEVSIEWESAYGYQYGMTKSKSYH